ncbi:MAG: phage holin family protein [Actinomyces sp.]|nr:phage holin family protein [Actinomyces sp.]MDN6429969.1 phage holin family protein [Propionibacterium sp.]MDN6795237.1 phage holin family protein [Propionibacterium sp.]
MSTDEHHRFGPGPSEEDNAQAHPATLGELFAKLSEQVSTLIQGEIELTKTKATTFLKKVGAGASLIGLGAILGLYLLGWVFHTIEVAIAVALPAWAAALIVTALIAVVIAVLVLVGVKLIRKGQEHTPAPQVGLQQDVDAFRKGLGK